MSLLDELNPTCPRGCGRTMDDCHEQEEGGQCAGGELLHEKEKLEREFARLLSDYERRGAELADAKGNAARFKNQLKHRQDDYRRTLHDVMECAATVIADLRDAMRKLRDDRDGLIEHGKVLRTELAEARRGRDETEAWRMRLVKQVRELQQKLNVAERKVNAVRMVKLWKNEDGKWFVFADDLWAITDPEAQRPSQADVTAAVAHAVEVGSRNAARDTVVEAAKAWKAAFHPANTPLDPDCYTGDEIGLWNAVDALDRLISDAQPSSSDGAGQTDEAEPTAAEVKATASAHMAEWRRQLLTALAREDDGKTISFYIGVLIGERDKARWQRDDARARVHFGHSGRYEHCLRLPCKEWQAADAAASVSAPAEDGTRTEPCGCIYGPGSRYRPCETTHQVVHFADIEVSAPAEEKA